jgi:hypothetical protein
MPTLAMGSVGYRHNENVNCFSHAIEPPLAELHLLAAEIIFHPPGPESQSSSAGLLKMISGGLAS